MTDLEAIRGYWSYADGQESKLMESIDAQFLRLADELQALLDQFQEKALSEPLSKRETERLHRRISEWKEQGFVESYDLKLYLRDLQNRSRIKQEEALFLWLFVAFASVYEKIQEQDKALFLRVSVHVWERERALLESGVKEGLSEKELTRFLAQGLPDGTAFSSQVYSYAEYAALRTFAAARADRQQGRRLSAASEAYRQVLNASKNRLLKRSVPSKGQTVNYHGYLDQTMTAVVGYTVMRVFQESNVENYKFIAVLDASTTDACRWLNGKVFRVADMKLGVNVPPITVGHDGTRIPHPCRSIIRAMKEKGD